MLSKHTQSIEEMKKEILLQQRDLLRERTKVKSLKTELENPLNVHRSDITWINKYNVRLYNYKNKDI